ncbi:MAG: DNA translocase FtsK [Verrucomicrobiales bacterium]|nr:DNA translocase FtsK [Verrucomicrobiales bacterium]
MPRQGSSDSSSTGRGRLDWIGLMLVAVALVWLLSLLTYDRLDLSTNTARPNDPAHNWIGPIGAWWAELSFLTFGAAAFLMPLSTLVFGLGCLAEAFSFARRRWPWFLVLLLISAAFFDLNAGLLKHVVGGDLAGGLFGSLLNKYLFRFVGSAGSLTAFVALYLLALLGLTDFQLFDWIRDAWRRRQEAAEASLDEELRLQKKAQQLEKEARRLQEMVDRERTTTARPSRAEAKAAATAASESKSKTDPAAADTFGVGPDLQPLPEPTVRDLSVPQPKPPAKTGKGAPAPGLGELEGVVIPASEINDAHSPAPTTSKTPAAHTAPKTEDHHPDDGEIEEIDDEEPTLPVAVKGKMISPRRRVVVASAPAIGNYQLPPYTLLQPPDLTIQPTESKEELIANARLMQQTLAQFGIEVSLGDITKGPTITRYELHPAPGVKFERITGLTNNIAAALKAERIHILAPVPGKSSVGIEVPNAVKTKVIMRDLLESEEWSRSKARIPLALGKDVYGHPMIVDLADMPHLLIAGSTGSGKSVCINCIIASLLYRFAPDQLRFVMIDPKVVELQQYNVLPHLVVPVVTDPKKVVLALRWVVNEMEKRYQIFAKVGVRNIKAFNERPKTPPVPSPQQELPLTATKEKVEASQEGFAVQLDQEMVTAQDDDIIIPDKLSYIVVIIDELADLMLVAPADVEMAIARITQMARAAGIHCIVATQRPSVDVITGVIKANIPARIAFQVASRVDSRTILDQMGADKLLGKGDMLYLPPGSAKLIRAQGALVTDQEIQSIVDFIAKQGKPSYEIEIHQQLQRPARDLDEDTSDEDEDLIEQCVEVIRSEGKASTSLLQRRLKIGYGRAARMIDILEERGIVGPARGAEPREILIDLDGQGHDGGKQQLV